MEDYATPELELVDIRQCPECGGYYPEDNAHGVNLFRHLMEDHPDGEIARFLRAEMIRNSV